MNAIRYPITSALLSEARLYAQESYGHTMDYQGWKDQKLKLARLTYGKFGQLWVAEFCRANGISHEKDTSSPYVADDRDLSIYGHSIDVKTTINRDFLGQVSPGVINKPCDYFCFVVTDVQCSFVEPVGFMDCDTYRSVAVQVKEGEGRCVAAEVLVGNRTVLMDEPDNLVQAILSGGFAPATAGNPRPYGMPPFRTLLGDDEVAALATYLRQSWGHRANGVAPHEVQALR